jgi:hypothetical protein
MADDDASPAPAAPADGDLGSAPTFVVAGLPVPALDGSVLADALGEHGAPPPPEGDVAAAAVAPDTAAASAAPDLEAAATPASPGGTPADKPAATRRGAAKKEAKTTFRQLFRYATPADVALNVLACVAAAVDGAIFPLFSLLFGELLNAFNAPSGGGSDFTETINRYALWFLLIAIGAAIAAFLENALIMVTAERQIRRVREEYLRALLRQDVGFYDLNKAGELAARLVEDSLTMSQGIAEKVSGSVRSAFTFIGASAPQPRAVRRAVGLTARLRPLLQPPTTAGRSLGRWAADGMSLPRHLTPPSSAAPRPRPPHPAPQAASRWALRAAGP